MSTCTSGITKEVGLLQRWVLSSLGRLATAHNIRTHGIWYAFPENEEYGSLSLGRLENTEPQCPMGHESCFIQICWALVH